MTRKVSIARRWTDPVPVGVDGKPIPENLWPQRRGHCWAVRWFGVLQEDKRLPDGTIKPKGSSVRCSRDFATKKDADEFRTSLQSQFNEGTRGRTIARRITLAQFTEEFCRIRTGPKGQRLKARSVASA